MSYYNSSGTYGSSSGGNTGGGGTPNPYFSGGYAQPTQGQQQQPANQQTNHQQQQQQNATFGQNVSYADPNQWKQQSQQPQQQQQSQYGMAQPPPQQQPQQSIFNPATMGVIAAGMSAVGNNPNTMVNIITPHAENFLKESTARMIPGLQTLMASLRSYFAVDNNYVKRKLQRIFIPFLYKSWQRQVFDAPMHPNQNSKPEATYALPRSDENAPDLYIPFMSLITYVLLCALTYGNAGKFSPEVLPEVAKWCFGSQILEVLLIRFGFYMMQAPVPFLDLFSYTGYKYFGLCINMLGAIATNHFGFGNETYYIFFLYTASSAAYFMLKTMANNIPMVVSATGPKREFMVIGFAASQFATMYFVSKTKYLT